jgi:hypothetical protein
MEKVYFHGQCWYHYGRTLASSSKGESFFLHWIKWKIVWFYGQKCNHTVVANSSHHPKIKGLIPTCLCWHHERKWQKFSSIDKDGSTGVDPSPHHQKVKGLIPAHLCWHHERKWEKFSSMDKDVSTVVDNSSHHPKVKGLIQACLCWHHERKWEKSSSMGKSSSIVAEYLVAEYLPH